jgi:uncharacterized OsmC-like protein
MSTSLNSHINADCQQVVKMVMLKANAKWIENVRSTVDNSRTHSVTCDLPTAQGGDDAGPTALELALMSLADCAVTIFSNVCKKSNIKFSKVETILEAEKDADSPKIISVKLKTTVTANSRKELLQGAWRRTEANCPVLSIFIDPIPLKIEFDTHRITVN